VFPLKGGEECQGSVSAGGKCGQVLRHKHYATLCEEGYVEGLEGWGIEAGQKGGEGNICVREARGSGNAKTLARELQAAWHPGLSQQGTKGNGRPRTGGTKTKEGFHEAHCRRTAGQTGGVQQLKALGKHSVVGTRESLSRGGYGGECGWCREYKERGWCECVLSCRVRENK